MAKKKIKIPLSYRQNLSTNLAKAFTGSQSKPQGNNPVGRPRGNFKHRSPFNGQPIPAVVYYKQIREFRRLQQQRANQVDRQQIQQLAKRGIPPEQAKQIVDVRQIRSVVPQQPQQIQNPPQSSAVRPIWRRKSVVNYEVDSMGNRRPILQGNDPRSFWN